MRRDEDHLLRTSRKDEETVDKMERRVPKKYWTENGGGD